MCQGLRPFHDTGLSTSAGFRAIFTRSSGNSQLRGPLGGHGNQAQRSRALALSSRLWNQQRSPPALGERAAT